MDFSLQNSNIRFIIISLIVAVVLFWAIVSGLNTGRSNAVSEVVYNNAVNIQKGLEFFYNDQGRIPSLTDFNDTAAMLNYFNIFPPFNFSSSNCSQSFDYKINANNGYTFSYCLPTSYNTSNSGWNQITNFPK